MSVNFDERSGVVPCKTPWGCWYQTMEEVFIEVQVPPGTQSRDIRCKLGIRDITLAVRDTQILQGRLYDATISDESTWTLEDKKLIRIVLTKSNRDAGNCWPSLLEGEYSADPWVQDEMQKKLTLERFQREVASVLSLCLVVTCWTCCPTLLSTVFSYHGHMLLLEEHHVEEMFPNLYFKWIRGASDVLYLIIAACEQNPGFDFSGAEISGNYSKGGPDFSNLSK